MAIADASVIIALAKMQRLALLEQVYGRVTIGPVVKREIVDAGRAVFAAGVEQVEEALQAGWIQLTRLSTKEQRTMQGVLKRSRLHEGEAESIALAQARKVVLIVDDKEARALAEAMHLDYIGTAGVVLKAFLSGEITREQLEETVERLSKTLWLSPAVVAEILRRARGAKP